MIEFIYDCLSPSPYCVPYKHKVKVWVENGQVNYSRQFITESTGKESTPIGSAFDIGTTPERIATMIHWGCSGTSKNSFELHNMVERIRPVVESVPIPASL